MMSTAPEVCVGAMGGESEVQNGSGGKGGVE